MALTPSAPIDSTAYFHEVDRRLIRCHLGIGFDSNCHCSPARMSLELDRILSFLIVMLERCKCRIQNELLGLRATFRTMKWSFECSKILLEYYLHYPRRERKDRQRMNLKIPPLNPEWIGMSLKKKNPYSVLPHLHLIRRGLYSLEPQNLASLFLNRFSFEKT